MLYFDIHNVFLSHVLGCVFFFFFFFFFFDILIVFYSPAVSDSGALYIEGSMRLESSLLQSGLVFSGEGQSAIDFTTDADFYEMPIKLCMQMMRPEFKFK